MNLGRHAFRTLSATGIVIACACAPASNLRAGPSPTALPLSRCDDSSGIFCVVAFGLEPPDQMLIALLAPLGGFQDIRLDVWYLGSKTAYPCEEPADSPHNFNCKGPKLPLGSAIQIDLLAANVNTRIASGHFVIEALALPTVPVGPLVNGVPRPTIIAAPMLTQETRSAAPTAYPTAFAPPSPGTALPTAFAPPTATPGAPPSPGTAYPTAFASPTTAPTGPPSPGTPSPSPRPPRPPPPNSP